MLIQFEKFPPRRTLHSLRFRSGLVLTALLASFALPGSGTLTSRSVADEVDFASQIRPILSDKCYTCHGPDSAHRQGGLRLDQHDSALQGGDSGAEAIVPGDPELSELVRRILSDDPSEQMPPPDEEKQLSDAERELLVEWLRSGAEWQELWSLVPPQWPELPAVSNPDWVSNDIDRFVLARLDRMGLHPSRQADPATLLRRVTLDLTGVPPTVEELQEYLADPSDDAYLRVVERLLASPRFGEHQARYWLDAARYGDTHGLHLDNYREIWPYRDWVVSAFNRNLPFDQFVTQQLAGDLFPEPTLEQLVATGFNRCHVTTNEGGSIAEEVRVRNVVDRTVTFGTVFLGLTLDCTRCHDHKYDPLTMEDFYSLSAFFNSIDGEPMDGNRKDHAPVIRVPDEDQQTRLAILDSEIDELRSRLEGEWPENDRAQLAWEDQLASEDQLVPEKTASRLASSADADESRTDASETGDIASAEATDVEPLRLGTWQHIGPFPDNLRYLVRRSHGPEGKAVDLQQTFDSGVETLAWTARPDWVDGKPHTDLPGEVAANFLTRRIVSPQARTVEISVGSDDGVKVYLNSKKILDRDVARAVQPDQERIKLDLQAGDNELLIKVMNYGGVSGFYFRLIDEPTDLPDEVLQALAVGRGERSDEQQEVIRSFFRNQVLADPEWIAIRDALAKSREARADVERGVPLTLVWKERAEPRPAHLLKRGEYDQVGEEVGRRVPGMLPAISPIEGQVPDRMDLARWLTSIDHPLLARVTVNRWWQSLFGNGLVKTSEDFGSQGEAPSHPQLLDWLSRTLIADGWDTKQTLRRIVLSSTYRQSSRVTEDLRRADPENRLLARGPRFRLDGEAIRDSVLASGGLLCEQPGGPSYKLPQPSGLWEAVGYTASDTANFKADEGHPKIHRRSLYTFIKRTSAPPQMTTLDSPNREACTVRRERTNTPLQALLLMNDVQFFEPARYLAESMLRATPEAAPQERARQLMMRVLCRPIAPAEAESLARAVGEERDHFASDPQRASRIAGYGTIPAVDDLDQVELASWTWAASLLFNLDEFVTKN